LKADKDFPNHVRDEEFQTVEFYKEYVMGKENYEE